MLLGSTAVLGTWTACLLAFVSPIYADVTQGQLVQVISTTSKNNTQRGAEQNCKKISEYLYRLEK
jgi:hypothetical protein